MQPFNQKKAENSLNAYIQVLLKPRTPEQVKQKNVFFAYIKRLLTQFHLYSTDIDEVINEAYIRASKYVQKDNKEIESYEALLKRICSRVTQEMRRKQKLHLDYDYLESKISRDDHYCQILIDLELLESFWQKFPLIDRKIIIWKNMDGLPWKEITKKLQQESYEVTEQALKKRYQRALVRLREKLN